jgi:hypothetical protein
MELVAEMRDLLASFYESFNTGDASRLENALAPDVLVIGTDEVEWWQGRDRALSVLRAQFDELRTSGVRLEGGEAQIVGTAESVWAADRPKMSLADGKTVPVRLTLVATKEGPGLLIRQWHFSVGTPNEEVLNQTLTV